MGLGGRYPNYGLAEAELRQRVTVRDSLIRKLLQTRIEVTPPLVTSAGPIRPATVHPGDVTLSVEEWETLREILLTPAEPPSSLVAVPGQCWSTWRHQEPEGTYGRQCTLPAGHRGEHGFAMPDGSFAWTAFD